MSTHIFDNITLKQILTLDTTGTLVSKNTDLQIVGDAGRHIILTTSGNGNIRQSNGATSKTAFVGSSQSNYTLGQNKIQLFQIILPSAVAAGDVKIYIKISDQLSGIRFEEYRGTLQMVDMTLFQLAVCGNMSTNLGSSGMTAFNNVNAAGAAIVTFQYTISVANNCNLNIWYFVEWLGDTNATVSGMTSQPVNISSVLVSASASSGAILNTIGTIISLPNSATSASYLSQFIDDITPPLYTAINSNTNALTNVNSVITSQSGSLLSENAIILGHTGSLASVSSSITSLNSVLIANTNSLSAVNLTINAESASLTSLTSAIAPLSNLGTYIANSLTTLNQITVANSASISSLQNMIQTTSANGTSASANITNLNAFTVTASQNLLSIQSTLSVVQINETSLSGSISSVSSFVGSSLGGIQLINSSLTTAVNYLQTGFSYLSASVSSSSGILNTVSSQLSTVSTAVINLQTGQTQQAGSLTFIAASVSSQNALIVQSNASLSNSISIAQTALSLMSSSISGNTSSISSITVAVSSSTGTILTGSISAQYGSVSQAYTGNLVSGTISTQKLITTGGQLSLTAGGANANSYTALAAAADASGAMTMFMNGSARTSDGGTLTGTIRNDAGGDMRFITSNTQGLYLQASSGFLGVNTSTPAYTVDVTSGTIAAGALNLPGSNTVNFGSDNLTKAAFAGNIGYQLATANALDIYGAGSAVGSRSVKLWDNVQVPGTMNAQQLGINTSTPSTSVDVNGSARVSGSLSLVSQTDYGFNMFNSSTNNANGYLHTLVATCASLSVGEASLLQIGQANSTNNAGYLGFVYNSAGASSNFMTVGLYASDKILNVTAARNVGINTTTPSYSLDVTGSCRITGPLTVGGAFSLVPPGTIHQYGGPSAPSGFLMCDGSAVSRTVYATLFNVISTLYGSGDGSSTFNIPNLMGKVAVGYNSSDTNFNSYGKTAGEAFHTLTSKEMPAHNHTVNDPGHTHGVTQAPHTHSSTVYPTTFDVQGNGKYCHAWCDGGYDPSYTVNAYSTRSITTTESSGTISVNNAQSTIGVNNTGQDQSHNNLQPYLVLAYIIKV